MAKPENVLFSTGAGISESEIPTSAEQDGRRRMIDWSKVTVNTGRTQNRGCWVSLEYKGLTVSLSDDRGICRRKK